MKKIILLLFIMNCVQCESFAQNKKAITGLETDLKRFEDTIKQLGSKVPPMFDSTRALILIQLSHEYWGNNPDKALEYAQQSLSLSEKIGFKKGSASAYNSMGVVSGDKGNNYPALEFHQKALKIYEELKSKNGIAKCYYEIGMIHHNLGNYPEALKNDLASLRIKEEMGNKKGMANCYNAIGVLYKEQGKYDDALKNFTISLRMSKESGVKGAIATAYCNVGVIKKIQGKFEIALKNYDSALVLYGEGGDRYGLAKVYDNMGSINMERKNYPEALKNMNEALKLYEETQDRNGISQAYFGIANIYKLNGDYSKALEYLNKIMALTKEINDKNMMQASYQSLAEINAKTSNYKEAYKNEVLYKQMFDSVFNKENEKKLTQLSMQYDFDKKESATKADQEKKDVQQRNIRNSISGSLAGSLIFLLVVYRQRNRIKKGKKRSDELLLNILPEAVAEELKMKGSADAKQIDEVTVLFTDFKGFTQLSEKLSPKELVAEINECFSAFDHIMEKFGIEKIKTIGDSYMAAGGLPTPNNTHSDDVVKAALEIQDFMKKHKSEREADGKPFFEARIGIHTGPIVAGIVGVKKFQYDIWGDTVNTASRMESSGEPGKVNISGTTYALVKDKFSCVARGKIEAKGKGEIDMYFVEE